MAIFETRIFASQNCKAEHEIKMELSKKNYSPAEIFPAADSQPNTGCTDHRRASSTAAAVGGKIRGRFPTIPPPVMCAAPRMPGLARKMGRSARL